MILQHTSNQVCYMEVDHEPSTCMYIVITTEWCPKYVISGWERYKIVRY